MRKIPFHLPDIDEEEIAAVTDVLRSGWLTTGARAVEFERDFRAYTGAGHAVAVSSGTAAMHLALRGLEIGPGDELITTPMTFCSTVHAIIQAGARPVLADIGEDLNIDPAMARALVNGRTRGILPVHMAGLPCDMDALRVPDVALVADAAHACGSEYKGKPIGGAEADATAFSFYATKTITTGEGGMLTTESDALAGKARLLRLHGIDRDAWNRRADEGNWFYEVVDDGYKYNLPDVLAAIGVAQLRKMERMRERRSAIAKAYDAAFGRAEELQLPPDRADCRHSWHLYILRLRLEALAISRNEFIEELQKLGVNCSVHFIPIPLHSYFAEKVARPLGCERALREYERSVSLPLYPRMPEEDVAHVIRAVTQTVERHACVRVHG